MATKDPNYMAFTHALTPFKLSIKVKIYGPRQANLVLIAYASSEGSGEPAQSRQNLRCSLIQGVSQEESSHRKPDPWPL